MKQILITYELKQGLDHSAFFAQLPLLGKWWHFIDNVWIIKTPDSPKDIFNKLVKTLYKGDHVFVIEIKPETKWGVMPMEAWKWFTE